MDKKLTKAQYEALKPYEKDIKSAYKNSFLRMIGSDFLKVAEIYADIFGQELTKSQKNCNTCRLNALKKLGELYINYETEPKKEAKPRRKKLEPKEEE